MRIVVTRKFSSTDATVSSVVVGALRLWGLEDEARAVKVYGETRIPAGIYRVGLRTEGSHHERYKKKFPDFHRGMLHILDVPGFQFILIHIGNTDEDTAGCLLVGMEYDLIPMTLKRSTEAYGLLYKAVVDAAAANDLEIEILDADKAAA